MTRQKLLNNELEPLSLGSIRPRGWLEKQLRTQADGLSGHLDEFWPDVAQSGWIGGSAEGWERGPYWLDGIVPLAFLLDDPTLKAKVKRWMEYILTHQHEDGWLGPVHDKQYGYEYDPWPIFIALKAFTQYQEATGDERVIPVMERFFQRLQTLLAEKPLTSWAQMRAADLVLSIYWLYRRTGADWLLDLARTVQQQGYDWQNQYANFPYTERQTQWMLENHLVNHTMAMKQPALSFQLSHDSADRAAVKEMIQTLERYHGQATGVFTGDEVLAGKNPSQGTELCAVVEYMFSLEVLVSVLGDAGFADMLERVTFNALPATFTSDMWAHQYDQQANQVLCAVSEDRVFATNGPDANTFGLEPNYGCCTANMHQGWPKYAASLWMRTADDGLAALSYAPCSLSTLLGGKHVQLTVETTYPFEERIRITITAEPGNSFPLLLRIPAWADGATLSVNEGVAESVQVGTFHRIERSWDAVTTLLLHLPMSLRTQTRYHNSVSLEWGPLVYALALAEEWRQIKGELPHADWEVHPLQAWNYALQIDRSHPERSCQLNARSVGEVPFSPEGAPLALIVRGRRVPAWTLEHNAAGPVPESPVSSDEALESLTLLPYGCTHLRITEFPTLADS